MKPFSIVLAIVFALSTVNAALGADIAQQTASFDVGNTHVDAYGNGEPALILIPGLTDSARAWTATIAHFAPTHTIYALTLAGFSGRPVAAPPLVDKAEADVAALIVREHLKKPVVIGHSLGGFLTIRFAEEHSALIGGAVAVDGLPVLAGMDALSPQERIAAATKMSQRMSKATPEQFLQGEKQIIPYMTKPQNVAAVTALGLGASPAASGEYMQELGGADLRSQLSLITVPLLELCPFDPTIDPLNPSSPMKTAQAKQQYYVRLLAADPTARVTVIEDSRHFIMFDQPQAFYDAVGGFLKTLSRSGAPADIPR